jgi:AAHS family benzoate transporter-like MFS transporter
MPLALTFTVVSLTGVFIDSAQTMIYATVSIRSAPDSCATAVGWTSGMGRFGAVFGPWLAGSCSLRTRATGASPPSRRRACAPWS